VAARRLILLMLALLVISSLAASLVPVDPSRLRESTTTTTAPEPKPVGGEPLRRTVDAGARRPSAIRIPLGDSLELTVTSSTPGLVEVDGLGESDYADPAAPARFDLRPYRIATYPVRFGDAGRPVARIKVSQPSARSERG
jgi:hypothetical protein